MFVVLAFVMGTIAVPTLHLVFHTLPHDHLADEIHYHAEASGDDSAEQPHGHGAGEHEHDRSEAAGHHHHDGAPPSHGHPDPSSDPRHGEGTSAHFSLALNDAPASSIALSFLGLTESGRIVPGAFAPLPTAHVSVQRFRGPPAGD